MITSLFRRRAAIPEVPPSNGALSMEAVDLTDAAAAGQVDAWLQNRASTPFHRPAWLRAVEAATGHRALMLAARDGNNAILGLLPLHVIRSPLFGRALVSSGFGVSGGILADDPSVAQALAERCWGLAESLNCTSAELRGGAIALPGWEVRQDTYLNFAKPLAPDDEQQLAAIPKRHRAEVRKGLANDLAFEVGDSRRLRDAHYRLYARSVHRLGTPVFPRQLFEEVLDAFGPDADIAMVSDPAGEPLSSVITLYHRGAAMPYWHGAGEEARAARSNEVLYFRLMGHARARGMTSFDFGRSKVGTGPAAWKHNWGWPAEPLAYAVRTAPGTQPRDMNPLSPRNQRKVEMWKRLPLLLANMIGPLIAMDLG